MYIPSGFDSRRRSNARVDYHNVALKAPQVSVFVMCNSKASKAALTLLKCQYCYYHNVSLTLLRCQYLYFCTRVKQVNSVPGRERGGHPRVRGGPAVGNQKFLKKKL